MRIESLDIEVGRYALRTFRIDVGRRLLLPISGGTNDDDAVWSGGTCLARCNHGRAHVPPADGCSCGIYGAITLASLVSQYPTLAVNIVAVIAVEGPTVVGAEGLRTHAARVVAYWCSSSPQLDCARDVLAEHCVSAAAFDDCQAMLERYNLSSTVIECNRSSIEDAAAPTNTAGDVQSIRDRATVRRWAPFCAIAAATVFGWILVAPIAFLPGESASAYARMHLVLSALITAHLVVPLMLIVSLEIGFWRAALNMRWLARHQTNYVASRSAEILAMVRLSTPSVLRTAGASLLAGSAVLLAYAVRAHGAGWAEVAAAAAAAAIVYEFRRPAADGQGAPAARA